MGFRDDREALRAQREQLQGELDRARRELEEKSARLDAHERKDADDERQLERLRREVERLQRRTGEARGHSWSRERLVMVAMVVGPIVLMGVVASVLVLTTRPDEVPAPVAIPAAQVAQVAPAPIPSVAPQLARFGAVVAGSTGRPDLPVGTGCVVSALLAPGPEPRDVRIECGETLVYSREMPGGMEITTSTSDAHELSRTDGTLAYRVLWRDQGQRTGPRPQVLLDSARSTLRIWADAPERYEVRLAIDDRSAPRRGTPLSSGPVAVPGAAGVRLAARVRSSSGSPPAPLDECELTIEPTDSLGPYDCRVRLRCGAELVYGAGTTGYNVCETEEAIPVRARDTSWTDGDPELTVDVTQRTLTVGGGDEGGRWDARFTLAEHPGCTLEGGWSGRLMLESGFEGAIALRDGTLRGGASDAERETAVELDCVRGEGVLSTADGTRFEGRFGPGFATFVGHVVGGPDPGTFELTRAH